MKNALLKIWQYSSVPVVLLCGGAVFSLLLHLFTQNGSYVAMPVRFALALILFALGMFLLRRMPKRSLVVSSAVMCVIALVYYLVLMYRLRIGSTADLQNVQSVLASFITLPNNIVMPFAVILGAENYPVMAIITTVIEILLPMLFAISSIFNGRRKVSQEH